MNGLNELYTRLKYSASPIQYDRRGRYGDGYDSYEHGVYGSEMNKYDSGYSHQPPNERYYAEDGYGRYG